MTKVSNLPNHYSCLEDLTLYRWDKYVQTKDNNWFLVDYDGREKKLICDELKDVENKLVDDYFKLVDDRSFSLKMQKWAKIDSLRTKYHVVGLLLERMKKGFADWQMENRWFIVQELNSWGFKYPELNSVEADNELTAKYFTALEGISTQIGILTNELKEEGRKAEHNLYEQIKLVTLALKFPYRIDPRTCVVSEWIAYLKEVEQIAKQN